MAPAPSDRNARQGQAPNHHVRSDEDASRSTSARPAHHGRHQRLAAAYLASRIAVISLLLALPAATTSARADEACRFDGIASHAGHITATTRVAAANGATVVDVTLDVHATVWWVIEVHYLVQEISTWRRGELGEVAVNIRSLADGRIVRQSWDVFTRGEHGLEARRVQAKTLADLSRTHPSFLRHWDPATFGQPWRQDYDAAVPERRPDLDLPADQASPSLRTPLAMAFYWTRWLPPQAQATTVFLPGFKRDSSIELDLASGTRLPGPAQPDPGAPDPSARLWRTKLRHPALSPDPVSEAAAWVAPDHRLLQLEFDLHARLGTAAGRVRAVGCKGSALAPG